jgi:hypothetical protein
MVGDTVGITFPEAVMVIAGLVKGHIPSVAVTEYCPTEDAP